MNTLSANKKTANGKAGAVAMLGTAEKPVAVKIALVDEAGNAIIVSGASVIWDKGKDGKVRPYLVVTGVMGADERGIAAIWGEGVWKSLEPISLAFNSLAHAAKAKGDARKRAEEMGAGNERVVRMRRITLPFEKSVLALAKRRERVCTCGIYDDAEAIVFGSEKGESGEVSSWIILTGELPATMRLPVSSSADDEKGTGEGTSYSLPPFLVQLRNERDGGDANFKVSGGDSVEKDSLLARLTGGLHNVYVHTATIDDTEEGAAWIASVDDYRLLNLWHVRARHTEEDGNAGIALTHILARNLTSDTDTLALARIGNKSSHYPVVVIHGSKYEAEMTVRAAGRMEAIWFKDLGEYGVYPLHTFWQAAHIPDAMHRLFVIVPPSLQRKAAILYPEKVARIPEAHSPRRRWGGATLYKLRLLDTEEDEAEEAWKVSGAGILFPFVVYGLELLGVEDEAESETTILHLLALTNESGRKEAGVETDTPPLPARTLSGVRPLPNVLLIRLRIPTAAFRIPRADFVAGIPDADTPSVDTYGELAMERYLTSQRWGVTVDYEPIYATREKDNEGDVGRIFSLHVARMPDGRKVLWLVSGRGELFTMPSPAR